MGHTLIVGAGPAGLALALGLAGADHPVTLIDSATALGRGFRGEALMPSGFDALEGLGLLPLPTTLRQSPLQGWSFWLERRLLFRAEEPMGCRHGCRLVACEDLLPAWGERLSELPAARLQLGRTATGVIEREGRIHGVRLADGDELEADLVIACDGRHSPLRRAAGLELEQQQRPIDVLWFRLQGATANQLAERLAGRFHTVIGAEGSMALYGSASGGVQLGWPLEPGTRPERSTEHWRELWLRLCPPDLAEAMAAIPAAAIEGPLRLPVQVGLARRWWKPGLLLLGDAAHPMSPLRAQGTSMALRDALSACHHLSGALDTEAAGPSDDNLDSALARIEAERRPEIVRIQALQQQEWQRGQRLAMHSIPRRVLSCLSPGLGPLLSAFWRHSQRELRLGLGEPAGQGPP